MTKKTHMASSVLMTGALIIYTPAAVLPSIAGGFLGATMPDMDYLNHRGFSHSILCAVIWGMLAWAISPSFGFVLCSNYLLHILLDSFTKMGVPILDPFDKNYYGAKIIKTGDEYDNFLCLFLVFVISSLFANM